MKRSSRGPDDTFFDELRTWSDIKLRILRKYCDTYQKIRGSAQPLIYYVDGFAGRGYFGEGPDRQPGSPVLLAQVAQEARAAGKPYRVVCINVEIRQDWFTDLSEALAAFDSEIVRLLCGDFHARLPEILGIIQSAPAVFFLDPFGVKQIKLADIDPLLRRNDTELFINFNTPRLRKLAGFEDSDAPEAGAKIRLVSEVLGEDPMDQAPEWLDQWHRLNKNGTKWEKWAVNKYIERLVNRSPHLSRAVAYPVRERYDSSPKYYLIFASRYPKAFSIVNDLVCTEEDNLFERTDAAKRGPQMSLFESERLSGQETRLQETLDEIHAFGLANQGCLRPHIIDHFIMKDFGALKIKHYRRAVGELVAQRRARFSNNRANDNDAITFL